MRWLKISEELPDYFELVQLKCKDGSKIDGYYSILNKDFKKIVFMTNDMECIDVKNVTHWRKILKNTTIA